MALEFIAWKYDDGRVAEFFDYAGFRVRDMRDPLNEAADRLIDSIRLAFATEGWSTGEEWEPLNVAYSIEKEKKHPGSPMLVASGKLFREATSKRNVLVDRTSMTYLLEDPPYGEWNQDGQRWNLPARPFAVVDDALELQITMIFYDWLEGVKSRNTSRSSVDIIHPLEFE